MRGRIRAFALTIFGGLALLAFLAPTASAQFPQFGISHFGADNDPLTGAQMASVSFNTRTNQHLVVYIAGSRATNDDEDHWNVFAQRVAANGAVVGAPIQVNAPTTNQLCDFEPPSVAYGRKTNTWIVTWDEGTATSCDNAIYAQLIDANGNLIGPRSEAISASGYDDIETNPVVYNTKQDEFFVVWTAEAPGQPGFQNLFGQRLSSAGAQVFDDQQLTHFTGTDSSADDAVGVAYNSKDQRYLAVVRGIDKGITGNTRDEIFGHLMSTDGTAIGADRFRISHVSATNPTTGAAKPPSVAYDPVNNRFLVAWTGNPAINSMDPDENEVFAQLLGADGSLLAPADIQISHMGPDGTKTFSPFRPRIAFNQFTRQYLLDWSGDSNTEGAVDNESEIWGQAVAADGNPTGPSNFRISHNGPDGDINFAAGRPDIAFNAVSCNYLTVWHTGNLANSFGKDTEKINIFGNTLPGTACPPPAITKQGKATFKKGVVNSPISVNCPDIEECPVTLTATVKGGGKKGGGKASEAKKKGKKKKKALTVATASPTVPIATTQKLSFPLTKKGSKLLRSKGKLNLKVQVTAKIGNGGPPVTSTLKFTVKKGKGKKGGGKKK
jgi:hypothetical protein